MPILYSFRRCPYAIRARFALSLANISHEIREIELKDKPAAMLASSPKGTVPVLVLADRVIDESIDIVSWAFWQNMPKDWHFLPVDVTKVAVVESLHKVFIPALNRHKYQNRYTDVDPKLELENIINFLELLNGYFIDNHFIITNKPTIVDLIMFPFIRQLYVHDESIFASSANNNFVLWYKWFVNNAIFQDVMMKRAVWRQPGSN